jgi:diaminohydroxyphosphoribosylaminopyrimidine deaminase/5-amino-6-(5-phosphoribosylamino)uracil reductase
LNHETYMREALSLAAIPEGITTPNPMVGAILVKNGKIIGKGYHPKFGEKHAEIIAIENAQRSVEVATLYCNLEPCCHKTPDKKTPPCTDRIIHEKIKRVITSTIDPNPHVNGKGIEILKQAGIEVTTGILAKEAVFLNEIYFKYIQTKIPFIHLKMAQTLDGKIATQSYDSRWITDEEAREEVHRMRHKYSGILVGLNTIKTDNPKLTARLGLSGIPFRIVLDTKLDIPLNSNILNDKFSDKTILFTTPNHNSKVKEQLIQKGIKINVVNGNGTGMVNLHQVVDNLGKMGVTSILVEGGSKIFTHFIRDSLFDKMSVFIAPIIIGQGINVIGDLGTEKISNALKLEKVIFKHINKQIVVEGYRDISSTFGKLRGAI